MPYLRRRSARVSSRTRSAPHTASLEALKVARLARAGILEDEGIGGQKDGGAGRADAADDLARLEGRGMAAPPLPPAISGSSVPPSARNNGRRAAGLNTTSLGIELDMGAHLGDIGQDVAVAQRHALGLALGARGEQDGGGRLSGSAPRPAQGRRQAARHGRDLSASESLSRTSSR